MVEGNWISTCGRIKLDNYYSSYKNPKYMKDLNVRPKCTRRKCRRNVLFKVFNN